MIETAAGWFWALLGVYAGMGVVFAVPFVLRWAGKLDASAQTGSWGFRVIIFPGVVALWPVLAGKVWRMAQGRYAPPVAEKPVAPRCLRRAHQWSFRVLAVAVPVICATALVLRPPETPASPGADGKLFPQVLAGPVVSRTVVGVDGLAATVELRVKDEAAQAQLTLKTAPKEPVIALYWSPTHGDGSLPPDAVFLGSVWGPAELPFSLPAEAATRYGYLYFLSLSNDQRLLATVSLGGK